MENKILKNIIEKEKFDIKMINFKPKARAVLGMSRGFYLTYKDKWIYLGYSYDISGIFRKLLEETYPNLEFENYPKSFFNEFIHKKYIQSLDKAKWTEEVKQAYYKKMRIIIREKKIKRLEEELLKLKMENNDK